VPPTEVSFSQLKELKSLNMLVQLVWPEIDTVVCVNRREYMYSFLL
jgi:hypothetical protein